MSQYPTAADTFWTVAGKFSTKNLTVTLNGEHNALVTTFNFNSDPAAAGWPATNGIFSVGDEEITYEALSGNSATGCGRGYGPSNPDTHANGATCSAKATENSVNDLNGAVAAIQSTLGISSAYNFVAITGTQSVAGLKTFSTGLALGANPAGTGVLRLPNNSPAYGRNAANSGDVALWKINGTNELEFSPPVRCASDLYLPADPDANLKAATKQYVDTQRDTRLSTGGGTMTGDIVLPADPDSALKASTKQYVDNSITTQRRKSLYTHVSAVSTNTTLDDTHGVVAVTTGATDKTITLPTAVGIADRAYTIVKVDSDVGAVLIRTTSAQTINGNATGYDLGAQWQRVSLVSDNANWIVIHAN